MYHMYIRYNTIKSYLLILLRNTVAQRIIVAKNGCGEFQRRSGMAELYDWCVNQVDKPVIEPDHTPFTGTILHTCEKIGDMPQQF